MRVGLGPLWKVDDAATAVLMELFYTNLWEKKRPALEALHQAQLAVLRAPGLVERRRARTPAHGIAEAPAKLPQAGRLATPDPAASRPGPALWAAFVLSGDGR